MSRGSCRWLGGTAGVESASIDQTAGMERELGRIASSCGLIGRKGTAIEWWVPIALGVPCLVVTPRGAGAGPRIVDFAADTAPDGRRRPVLGSRIGGPMVYRPRGAAPGVWGPPSERITVARAPSSPPTRGSSAFGSAVGTRGRAPLDMRPHVVRVKVEM